MTMKTLLQLTVAFVFLLTSAALSEAADIDPMQTSCAREIVARNNKSVAHWSNNVSLSPTSRSQWLMNSDTGYMAKVELNQYEYLKDTGEPAWTIIRFYKTPAVVDGIAKRKPTPTLTGFSNNFMFVQADGSCYVSEDRFDDLKYYTQKFAYYLARAVTSMSLGSSTGVLPPGIDDMFQQMTLQDLRLPIDAAVQQLIKIDAGGAGATTKKAASFDPNNLCPGPMQRVLVAVGPLKDMRFIATSTDGNFENFDNLKRFKGKKKLTALCFKEVDENYTTVEIPPEVTSCSFIRGNMECSTK